VTNGYTAKVPTCGSLLTRVITIRAEAKPGASDANVANDENATPETMNNAVELPLFLPTVVRFLGYVPYRPSNSFADWLKMRREVLGLSQEKLAERLGVDESSIKNWETGLHSPNRVSRQILDDFLQN
jgi:hypothetical protein